MTVTYTLKVSNAALCGFAKLLLRWKGSIYKLLYREMLIFILLYYGLSGLYRYVLSEDQRRIFEKIVLYCEAFTDLIPLSFVLGFYVSIVVGRWWQQYMSIPWPDKVVTLIGCHVYGNDERGRIIRRTLARYLNLMAVVTCQGISTSVKKRFPTIDHIVEAGLMSSEEKQIYDDLPIAHGKWWVPAQWFTSLLVRSRREGRIRDDVLLKQILDEMLAFRGCCGMLFGYDWISIPLVYTQVVTIAIYTFFLATLMGRQYLDPEKGYKGHEVDLYIPVFTILQFFFYMGWLKVAEQLINPFGEDDDDFELNWVIDRNIQISFLIVDEMCMKHPPIVKDIFWDELDPQLPYTKSSLNFKTEPHLGSAVDLNVNPNQAAFIPLNTITEEDAFKCPAASLSKSQQDNQFLEYPSISKRGSMLSLHSIRTTLQDLKNSFNDSNLDVCSQKCLQRSNADLGSHYLHNILSSDELMAQKRDLENQLLTTFSSGHSVEGTSSTAFNYLQQPQIPYPTHFIADTMLLLNTPPVHEAVLVCDAGNNSNSPDEIVWQTKETINQISENNINFNAHFIGEPWVSDQPNNASPDQLSAIIMNECDSNQIGENAGSYQLLNSFNCPNLHLSDIDSSGNESTVSSVAELLSHVAE